MLFFSHEPHEPGSFLSTVFVFVRVCGFFPIKKVWEGTDAVYFGRKLLGETRPYDSLPGTIRGDFCVEVGRNICHGSDAVESAEKEIALWFTPEELNDWAQVGEAWIYE